MAPFINGPESLDIGAAVTPSKSSLPSKIDTSLHVIRKESPLRDTVSTSDGSSPEPALLHRSLTHPPLLIARASGSYLYPTSGPKILDACGGAAVAVIGHGNEQVIGAAAAQMSRVSYVHTLAYVTSSAEELASHILSHDPSEPFFDHGLVKAFFVGSGSEANDTAMKCARQYWVERGQPQKKHFVSRNRSYHGNTIGAMSASGLHGRREPFLDILLPHISHVSAADSYRIPSGYSSEAAYVTSLLDEIEAEFLRIGPENIIAFMGETVSGAAMGSMPAPRGYWRGVRALCDRYDILLHLDEVMCSSGRCGTYFAFEQENITPDLVTIGKGLGGGYAPIAAMLINERIVDGLRRGSAAFNHGHTYQAHPVSCAAALAVQRIIRREGLLARCREQGKLLEKMLRDTLGDRCYVGDIRGRGLFWSVEFVQDKRDKTPFGESVRFGARVHTRVFDLGVALYPGAQDFVIFAPPYTVSCEELEMAVSALKKAYDEVALEVEMST